LLIEQGGVPTGTQFPFWQTFGDVQSPVSRHLGPHAPDLHTGLAGSLHSLSAVQALVAGGTHFPFWHTSVPVQSAVFLQLGPHTPSLQTGLLESLHSLLAAQPLLAGGSFFLPNTNAAINPSMINTANTPATIPNGKGFEVGGGLAAPDIF
jgi:hypothetical protein